MNDIRKSNAIGIINPEADIEKKRIRNASFEGNKKLNYLGYQNHLHYTIEEGYLKVQPVQRMTAEEIGWYFPKNASGIHALYRDLYDKSNQYLINIENAESANNPEPDRIVRKEYNNEKPDFLWLPGQDMCYSVIINAKGKFEKPPTLPDLESKVGESDDSPYGADSNKYPDMFPAIPYSGNAALCVGSKTRINYTLSDNSLVQLFKD